VRFAQPSQTILVTHYVDCTPFLAAPDQDQDQDPAASSPTIASPLHYYTLQQRADKRRRASRSPAVHHPVNGAPPWAFESTDEKATSGGDDEDGHEEKDGDIDDDASANGFAEVNPWPTEHEAFRASSLAQQRMCLEIASGCPVRRPEVRTTGPNQTVLIPGSLRERGEFSVVQVSLRETPPSQDEKGPAATASATSAGPSPLAGGGGTIQQDRGSTAASGVGGAERRNPKASSMKPSSNHKRTFSWVVQHVDFHRLNERKA
jgi:hypothetical protein